MSINRDSCKKGGGVMLFVHSKYTLHTIECSVTDSYELIHVQISWNSLFTHEIVAIYRPPAQPIPNLLTKLANIFSATKNKIMIIGDFNIPNSTLHRCDYMQFTDLLASFSLAIRNHAPTFPKNNSILDLVITDPNLINITLTSDKLPYSDHNLLVSTTLFPFKNPSTALIKRKISIINHQAASSQLNKSILNLAYSHSAPVDNICNALLNFTKGIIDSNTSTKVIKSRDVNFKCPPWADSKFIQIVNSIFNLQGKINKLANKGLPTDYLLTKLNNLLEIKNELETVKSKKYYHSLIINNRKLSWPIINELCGNRARSERFSLMLDGRSIADNEETANIFAELFASHSRLKTNLFTPNTVCLSPDRPSTFSFSPVDHDYVKYVILPSIKNKNSVSTDGIRSSYWKNANDHLIDLLTTLINRMFTDSTFPSALKIATVTPIHKKGDRANPSNFRPISVLPSLSKVLEKAMHNQIISYCNELNIFNNWQFGFRAGRGCLDAITHLLHYCSKEIDVGNSVILLSLDLSKAFDSISHEVILNKFRSIGFNDDALQLLTSYLAGRSFRVKANDALSSSFPISLGVQQGSLNGPTIFDISIFDIQYLKVCFKAIYYADDIIFIIVIKNLNSKNEDPHPAKFFENVSNVCNLLNEITDFFKLNQLNVNLSKSLFISIGPPAPVGIKFILSSAGFTEVDELPYLGIIIDKKLNFSSYINTLIKKLNQSIGVLIRLKDKLPTSSLLSFYYGHIHSHLCSSALILLRSNLGDLRRLQMIQARALKIIYSLEFSYPTHDLFIINTPKILPIRGLIFLSAVNMVRKILHSTLPLADEIRMSRSTRINLPIAHRAYSSFMTNDIMVKGVMLYNDLPQFVRSHSAFKDDFKRHAKRHFISIKDTLIL